METTAAKWMQPVRGHSATSHPISKCYKGTGMQLLGKAAREFIVSRPSVRLNLNWHNTFVNNFEKKDEIVYVAKI